MANVILSETDRKILRILYKLPYATSEHLALLLDEPIDYMTRRCLQLKDANLIGREYLVGGVLALNYLKKKGMRLLGLPFRNVTKPKMYNYEHILGEIQMYIFIALNPKLPFKFGQIITERDILNSIVWDENGVTATGSKKVVARDVSMGIHRPDGYIFFAREGKPCYIALEYERSKKSTKSNSNLLNNLDSNSKLFERQYWFCDSKQVRNKVEKTTRSYHNVQFANHEKIVSTLEKLSQKLPKKLSSKEDREPRDFIGPWLEPVPLTEIEQREVELEK